MDENIEDIDEFQIEDEIDEEDYYLIDHFCFTPEEIEEFLAEGIPEERII